MDWVVKLLKIIFCCTVIFGLFIILFFLLDITDDIHEIKSELQNIKRSL